MATIQRPTKEGSVRTYQAKVGLGYVDILASEMDADLDTIYAAWNGGTDTINIKDGSITYAKLAPDAQLWSDTGTALTPGANFTSRVVTVPGPGAGGSALCMGTRTAKFRVLTDLTSADWSALVLNNPNAPEVSAQSSWALNLSSTANNTDAFILQRRAPGAAAAAVTNMLTLDAAGKLTIPGPAGAGTDQTQLVLGLNPERGRIAQLPGVPGWFGLFVNGSFNGSSWAADDAGRPIWRLILDSHADTISFQRAAGATPNTTVTNFTVDGGANLTIQGATATKASGTTWANPSDRRLKDEIADYPTGLAAVLQLLPRTFVYNGQGGSTAGMRGYGFIADEVATAMPDMLGSYHYTREGAADTETDYETVDQSNLILALVNAVKELAGRVVALEGAAA
jgi:hypothetical protein